MKKILLIAVFAVLGIAAQAQVTLISSGGSFTTGSNPYYTTRDTVDDDGTQEYYVRIPNRWQFVTFQVNMTKISGDPSAVTVAIYNAVDTAGALYDSTPIFTKTLPDASHTVVHEITGNPVSHYKVVVTGSGTQSSSYKAMVFIR